MFARFAVVSRNISIICLNYPYRGIVNKAGHPLLLNMASAETFARPKVYVTRRVPQKGLDVLTEYCDVTQWDSDDPVPHDHLISHVKGVDGIFCLLTDNIDKAVLDAAGASLRVVSTLSAGFDHIDVAECARRGVPVGITADVLTDATAELAVALLLATSRKIGQGINAVKSGEWGSWKPMWLCGPGLLDSTVGIVGLGRIGLAVARRLLPFGVSKFLYAGRTKRPQVEQELKANFVSLDKLLGESDFVVVCCALNKDSQGMFNAGAFEKMKPTSVLVNISRGAVVDQEALVMALRTGQIGAAGLDVTTPEPLPMDHPLLSLSNCVVLPHIGSATHQTRSVMSELAARNIIAAFTNQPLPSQLKM